MISPIAAIVYADGVYPDRLLRQVIGPLRDRGVPLAGLLQVEQGMAASEHPCDRVLEDLTSGVTGALAEDRGRHARGCRLDVGMLTELADSIQASLHADAPHLLVINKFGKVEAQGGGMRAAIADAVALGIPALVGVPVRNLDSWRAFTAGFATELAPETAAIERWLTGHGLGGDAPRGDEDRPIEARH
jgi:hypothetical protein